MFFFPLLTEFLIPYGVFLFVYGNSVLCTAPASAVGTGSAFSFSVSEIQLSVLILIKLLTLPCHVTVLSSRADPTCRLVRTPEGQGIQ